MYFCIPLRFPIKKQIHYEQWQLNDEKKLKIFINYTTSAEIGIKKLQSLLPSFKIHSYIKNVQLKQFRDIRESLNINEFLLQIDFSENYRTMFQDEIQAAHWNHEQVTLFTACAWFEGGIKKSVVVVSDDLTHDKVAVWVY